MFGLVWFWVLFWFFFARGQLMLGYSVKNITEIIPPEVEENTKEYSLAL